MTKRPRIILLACAALALVGNTPPPGPSAEPIPELSFFERAELPEATLNNFEAFARKMTEVYPIPIIRREYSGTAKINVLVTKEGRAVRCQIKKSSGNAIIDRWACRGTERYARFEPATNDEDEPVLSQWTQDFTMTLGKPDGVQEQLAPKPPTNHLSASTN